MDWKHCHCETQTHWLRVLTCYTVRPLHEYSMVVGAAVRWQPKKASKTTRMQLRF
jgi:hypothetical protein